MDLGLGQRWVWEGFRKVRRSSWQTLAKLERNKLEVSKYNKKGFDPGLSKDECWCVSSIPEQMEEKDEKKGHATAIDTWMSERAT